MVGSFQSLAARRINDSPEIDTNTRRAVSNSESECSNQYATSAGLNIYKRKRTRACKRARFLVYCQIKFKMIFSWIQNSITLPRPLSILDAITSSGMDHINCLITTMLHTYSKGNRQVIPKSVKLRLKATRARVCIAETSRLQL